MRAQRERGPEPEHLRDALGLPRGSRPSMFSVVTDGNLEAASAWLSDPKRGSPQTDRTAPALPVALPPPLLPGARPSQQQPPPAKGTPRLPCNPAPHAGLAVGTPGPGAGLGFYGGVGLRAGAGQVGQGLLLVGTGPRARPRPCRGGGYPVARAACNAHSPSEDESLLDWRLGGLGENARRAGAPHVTQ